MTASDSKYSWEEWQLTAYLLCELEPEMMAEMAAAAAKDPQLAAQLKELSKTLDDVKAVLSLDGTAVHDQAALSALKAGFMSESGEAVTAPTFTLRRLVTRWENWLSLAGLILIGVLLYQRPGAERQPLARLTGGAPSTVSSNTDKGRSTLDETVVREAWDQTSSLASRPVPMPSSPSMSLSAMSGAEGSEGGMMSNEALAMGGMSGGAMGAGQQGAGQQAGGRGAMSGGAMGGMGGGMSGGMGGGGMGGGMGMGMGMDGGGGMDMGGRMTGNGMMGVMGEGEMLFDEFGMGRAHQTYNDPTRGYRQPHDPQSGDRFARFADNDFQKVDDQPLSTFSIDVDTASYAKTRQFMLELHRAPPPAAVRIEEFINYFDYDYPVRKMTNPLRLRWR